MPDILDFVKQIADKDVIKDVLPKGPDGLKKLRDIDSALSSQIQAGAAAIQGMLSQLPISITQLSAIISNITLQPTTPTGASVATHEDAAKAISEAIIAAQAYLNLLNDIETVLDFLYNMKKNTSHEIFISNMEKVDTIMLYLASVDLTVLQTADIAKLFSGFIKILTIIQEEDENWLVDYDLAKIIYSFPEIFIDMTFYGIDLTKLPLEQLFSLLRGQDTEILGTTYIRILNEAADILEEKIKQTWTPDICISAAIRDFLPAFKALFEGGKEPTYETLTALIMSLLNSLQACKIQQTLGNVSSASIPDIGSMIDQTLMNYIKKAITDPEKIKKAVEKFTQKQAIIEKKRKIVEGMHEKGDSSSEPEGRVDIGEVKQVPDEETFPEEGSRPEAW